MVASCSMDRTVKLWDINSLGLKITLQGHSKVRKLNNMLLGHPKISS